MSRTIVIGRYKSWLKLFVPSLAVWIVCLVSSSTTAVVISSIILGVVIGAFVQAHGRK